MLANFPELLDSVLVVAGLALVVSGLVSSVSCVLIGATS